MSATPFFYATRRTEPTIFIPGFATRPRIIYTPGASGSDILGISVASSDNASQTVQFGIARPLTKNELTGHLVNGGGGAHTITRTAGSFVTDGWRPGDRVFVQDATTLANDNIALCTAVAALTLTLPTGFVTTDELFNAATGIYRVALLHSVSVPSGAGGASAVAVSGLDTTQEPMLDASPDRKITLGPNERLVAYLANTLTTGETVDITVLGSDY